MNGLITDIYMHVFFFKKKFVGIRKGANTNQLEISGAAVNQNHSHNISSNNSSGSDERLSDYL